MSDVGPFDGYKVERMGDEEVVLTLLGAEGADDISMSLTLLDADEMGHALTEVANP